MRVANAPCSWGVLEFEDTERSAPSSQVLDEIASTGYEGTELGDWGFMPTDPPQLIAELAMAPALHAWRFRSCPPRRCEHAHRWSRNRDPNGAAAGRGRRYDAVDRSG